jgi:hypothetical protein
MMSSSLAASAIPRTGDRALGRRGMWSRTGPMRERPLNENRMQASEHADQHGHGAAARRRRSVHLQLFVARFAKGAQRIGKAVDDRVSDPGECRILLGISIFSALSAAAMTLGDDSTRIRLSVA